ncbi:hypothetical protein ACR6C2_00510 [Streptomyces sp. INA 01156]
MKARSTGPRRYAAERKTRILAECEMLDKKGRGALLWREGLYSSLITTWRQQRDKGALDALAASAGRPKAPAAAWIDKLAPDGPLIRHSVRPIYLP